MSGKLIVSCLVVVLLAGAAFFPSGKAGELDYLANIERQVVRKITRITELVGFPINAYTYNPAIDPSSLVAAHNKWRAEVGVPTLKWSDALTRTAQAWADTLKDKNCALTHSAQRSHGENVFWASPISWSDGKTEPQKVTGEEVVDDWASEVNDYQYESNTCTGKCGHYTQIVWRTTEEVGCGMAICSDKGQVWVCRYNPPGNYKGERPY